MQGTGEKLAKPLGLLEFVLRVRLLFVLARETSKRKTLKQGRVLGL